MVGIVQEITNENHGYNVHVDLEGDFYRRAFRSDQLKLVAGATQQHRQGLSRGGKIGWAIGAVCIVFLAIASIVIAASNTRDQAHSPSYQMGYDAAAPQPGVPRMRGLSDSQISGFCSDLLQARIAGTVAGTNTQLPLDFSSQDFLTGCTDASQVYKEP
jgi:hypothetical protein